MAQEQRKKTNNLSQEFETADPFLYFVIDLTQSTWNLFLSLNRPTKKKVYNKIIIKRI